MRPITRVSFLLLLTLLGGCATVNLDEDFSQAQTIIEERIGEPVEWAGVSADQQTIQARVDDLLAEPLDADDAVRVALLNQPRLQADFAELGIAAAGRVQAGLPSNPFLDLALKYNDGSGPASIELDLVTELLDLFFLPARKRIAAVAWERARIELAGRVIDLAFETRREFHTLQAERQILDMERDILLAMEAQYEASSRLREAGNITQLDLMVDRDLYEQTKLQISMRERSVANLRESLNRMMGLWGPRTEWDVEPELPPIPEGEDELSEFEALAVANSLDLRASLLTLEQIARERRITNITSVLPELEGGIAAEREVEEGHEEWWYGPAIGLEIPLFSQGQPQRARARLELLRQWNAVEYQAIRLRSLARSSARNLMYAREEAVYVRDVLLPLRVLITREAQLHYNAMFLGLFQLLDAKRREIEAARQYVELLRDYWIERATLDQLRAGRIPPNEVMGRVRGIDGNALLRGEGAEEGH